jgi:hypothetical protein
MQKIMYVKIYTVIHVMKYFLYYDSVPSVYFVSTCWSLSYCEDITSIF